MTTQTSIIIEIKSELLARHGIFDDYKADKISIGKLRELIAQALSDKFVVQFEELEKTKEALKWADEELSRLKTGKESQLVEEIIKLSAENKKLREMIDSS